MFPETCKVPDPDSEEGFSFLKANLFSLPVLFSTINKKIHKKKEDRKPVFLIFSY